jgi:uncharacterized protein
VPRGFYIALRDEQTGDWRFAPRPPGAAIDCNTLDPRVTTVRVVTVSVSIEPFTFTHFAIDLPLDPGHLRGEMPDSFLDVFADHRRNPNDPAAKVIANPGRTRTNPIVIENTGGLTDGLAVLDQFFAAQVGLRESLEDPGSTTTDRSISLVLTGGNDGMRPQAAAYEGTVDADHRKTGLLQFEDREDISIVAAPGLDFPLRGGGGLRPAGAEDGAQLINHAQKMRYRIAVLDSGDNQTVDQVRAMRAQFDSSYAALYYPWVRVLDPLTQREIFVRHRDSWRASMPGTTSSAACTRRPRTRSCVSRSASSGC